MSSKRYHRDSSDCEDEPDSKVQRTAEYEIPDDIKQAIVRQMMVILHRLRGKEKTLEDDQEIENLSAMGFETDEEFERRTNKLSKKQKTSELVKRVSAYNKRMFFVLEKWQELVEKDNEEGNVHIKKDPYKSTQIDDFFDHDSQIYDERNYEHNNNIQLKEDRPHSSNSAGELVVTEGDDIQGDAEPGGFKGSIVFGFKGLPNKLQKEKVRVKTRQQRNGFDKPDPSMVTAKDLQMKHPDMGRCKICYWCTKGYLARSMYSLEKKKFEGEDFREILSEDPHKAAMIAGSNFKMKYYEMRDVFSPEESCATLARIWNARIRYMRQKYSEKMTQTQMEESIDDFFGMIDKQIGSSTHDKTLYDFSGSKAKTIEDYEYERSLDGLEEEVDEKYSFMPPEVDVDDFRHHFKTCLKSDVENILLEKLVEVNSHLSIIGDNLVFTKTLSGPLDEKATKEDQPEIQKVGQLNHINCHMYYQGIDRLVKLASEHRQTQRENKHSGMLYQNLGLFKDTVPNLTGIDTLRAIKYRGSNKGRSFKKGQYRGGETSGV
jgi:hypothetical protein